MPAFFWPRPRILLRATARGMNALDKARRSAGRLTLTELRQLATWLAEQIVNREAKARGKKGRVVVEVRCIAGVLYQLEFVRCGKSNCRCSRGKQLHGPYWYAYWKDDEGRSRTQYVGKELQTILVGTDTHGGERRRPRSTVHDSGGGKVSGRNRGARPQAHQHGAAKSRAKAAGRAEPLHEKRA